MDIWTACKKGYVEYVQKYVDTGKDIEAKDAIWNPGSTPLLWASRYEHKEIVEFLVKRGADIEARSNRGMTPIMWASSKEYKSDIVRFLAEKGANLDAQDNDGWTAIMHASRWRRNNIVCFLTESGANVILRNNDGETAYSIALDEGNLSIVEYLAPLTISFPSVPYSSVSIASFIPRPRRRQISVYDHDVHADLVKLVKKVIPIYMKRVVKDPQFAFDMQCDTEKILGRKKDGNRKPLVTLPPHEWSGLLKVWFRVGFQPYALELLTNAHL